ncbi:unnamed protein product [Ophioblennius macclurei]
MAPVALRVLCLLLPLLLPLQVVSDASDDFDLSDALGGSEAPATPKPAAPAPPGGGKGKTEGDFNLEDLFDLDDPVSITTTTTKAPPKVVPKAPAATKAPAKPKPKQAADEFDLADALDPKNDLDRKKGQGGGFSDSDLFDVGEDDSYKPDKGKGGRPSADDRINQHDDNGETTAEVGTIAGIVSAVAMALVGAISSYISYQKKKLCFSIQQSLNTDMVKAENPDAVVAVEPQAQQTLLEPPNAEPPTEENAV